MESCLVDFIVSFVSYMDRVNLSVATPVIMKEYGFDKMIWDLFNHFSLPVML